MPSNCLAYFVEAAAGCSREAEPRESRIVSPRWQTLLESGEGKGKQFAKQSVKWMMLLKKNMEFGRGAA